MPHGAVWLGGPRSSGRRALADCSTRAGRRQDSPEGGDAVGTCASAGDHTRAEWKVWPGWGEWLLTPAPAPPESHVRAIVRCPRRQHREPGQRASALHVPGGQRRAHRCRHVRRQLDAGPAGGRPRGQLPGAVVGPPSGAVPDGDRHRPAPPRTVAGTPRPGPHRRRGPAPRAYALDPRTPAAGGRRDLGLLRGLRRLPQPQVPAAAGAGREVRQRAARAGPPPAARARPRDPDAGPLRDRAVRTRAVGGLPRLHPPRRDPRDRVAGLVAQHRPRLVVRHRAGDRVDPRRGRPTTCCRRWARGSCTPG